MFLKILQPVKVDNVRIYYFIENSERNETRGTIKGTPHTFDKNLTNH